jgi:2-oxoacid:acceptor oxidoreductase delta subunit (pyruvate/2-ketoisovalerate family)
MGFFSRHKEKRVVKKAEKKKVVKHVKKVVKPVKKAKTVKVKHIRERTVKKAVKKARPAKVKKMAEARQGKQRIEKRAEKRSGITNENELVYDIKKVPVMKNVTEEKTRLFRPKIDLKKCQKTYNCFLFCPRGAITIGAGGNPEINYTLCDGCLICLRECPSVAIIEERE